MRFKLDTAQKDQVELLVRVWFKKFGAGRDRPLEADARRDLDLIVDTISLLTEYSVNAPTKEEQA
mgnify:CR=1 FL=1